MIDRINVPKLFSMTSNRTRSVQSGSPMFFPDEMRPHRGVPVEPLAALGGHRAHGRSSEIVGGLERSATTWMPCRESFRHSRPFVQHLRRASFPGR
jgi:hypothetical protein